MNDPNELFALIKKDIERYCNEAAREFASSKSVVANLFCTPAHLDGKSLLKPHMTNGS